MVIRNKCYNTCFYLHEHCFLSAITAYVDMDLNAKYVKHLLRYLRQSIQIRISPKRVKCTWNSTCKQNVGQKEDLMHSNFQMDISLPWIDAAFTLTPQALSKYIYLSPPLFLPTTSTELGQKTTRCESLRALLHYLEWDRIVPSLEQKRTESYVIVSR